MEIPQYLSLLPTRLVNNIRGYWHSRTHVVELFTVFLDISHSFVHQPHLMYEVSILT